MASPEVERPPLMASPSNLGVPGSNPSLANSGDKRKTLHFKYNRYVKQPKQSTNFAIQTPNSSNRRSSSGNASTSNFPARKRSYSFSEGHCKSVTSVTPAKRWKRGKDAKKFLLGGNIRDPLNLNSLSDEKVSKAANAVTPEYSPIPTPKHRKAEYKIEVLIPNNISDPLNLMQEDNDEKYDASFNKKKSRPRKRNHNHRKVPHLGNISANSGAASSSNEENSPIKEVKKVRFNEETTSDSINQVKNPDIFSESAPKATQTEESASKASIPEPEIQKKETEERIQQETVKNVKNEKKNCKHSEKFQFGNYSRYYGYRLEGSDPRLQFFDPEWFGDKDVLDIGCNVGEVTMAVARDMGPKSILGIDIDPSLIDKARKSITQYASRKVPSAMATPNPGVEPTKTEQLFPQNLPLIFGPLDPMTQPQPKLMPPMTPSLFPNNVKFLCDNYVLEEDDLLAFAQPEFDTIMCLSTTKWIHLNFGDNGLKRAFKRMFSQLRSGGVLILEPQGLASYSKKARKINKVTKEHFNSMKLMPNQFVDYLINEVGFGGGEVIAVPEHSALGFRRPIHVFKKP